MAAIVRVEAAAGAVVEEQAAPCKPSRAATVAAGIVAVVCIRLLLCPASVVERHAAHGSLPAETQDGKRQEEHEHGDTLIELLCSVVDMI
jgi:hypothetical protein